MAVPPAKIDRQSTTPFHLKLFYRNNGSHRVEEFLTPTDLPPHLQIYTWASCTLRELSHLLTSALPDILPDPAIGTRLSYHHVFADTRNSGPASGPGKYLIKELGSVIVGDGGPGILPNEEEAVIVRGGQMDGPLQGEPERTLQESRFVIGDYVAVTITPALENGGVAPPPSGPLRGGFGGGRGEYGGRGGPPRENGFGGGYRGRGGSRGGGSFGQGFVPSGEWRRGERVPDGPSAGRGRGFGGFGGGGGGGGGGGRGRY